MLYYAVKYDNFWSDPEVPAPVVYEYAAICNPYHSKRKQRIKRRRQQQAAAERRELQARTQMQSNAGRTSPAVMQPSAVTSPRNCK